MREVDQPHDAEDQRQAGGEQRVEPAEQDALDDDVGEGGHGAIRRTPRLRTSPAGEIGVRRRLARAMRTSIRRLGDAAASSLPEIRRMDASRDSVAGAPASVMRPSEKQ